MARSLHLSGIASLAAIAALALTLAVLLLSTANSYLAQNQERIGATPASSTTPAPSGITVTTGVTIYPAALDAGAQWGCVDGNPVPSCGYSATVGNSYSEIMSYYSQTLIASGWRATRTTVVSASASSRAAYVWNNQAGYSPSRRLLVLNLSSNASGHGTMLSLTVRLWPDPTTIPTYPGAQDASRRLVPASIDNPARKYISYIVTASSDDIRRFYDAYMIEEGWEKGLYVDYTCSYRGFYTASSAINLSIERTAEGTATVVLEIMASDLESPTGLLEPSGSVPSPSSSCLPTLSGRDW